MKKRFLLRLDPGIYEALHRWADDDLRSVNGQIEYLLLEALRKAGRRRIRTDAQKAASERKSGAPDDR